MVYLLYVSGSNNGTKTFVSLLIVDPIADNFGRKGGIYQQYLWILQRLYKKPGLMAVTNNFIFHVS